MKIAVFERSGEKYVGQVLENENIIQRFDLTLKDFEFSGVTALIGRDLPLVTEEIPLDEVMLLAPVPRPLRNIFCVGKNYRDHAREFTSSGFDSSANKGTIPKAPIVFSKVPETVIGPGDPIKVDNTVSTEIDYEVELAVIIGKSGRKISREDAVSHVWGYTIINDVTARNLQGLHSQWLIGKSQDTFCPMGPWAVTTDEIDLNDTYIRCWVNGELRQDSNTNLLIFDVPEIISAISNGIMLNCGDVIATGTPAGVGIGFKPPKFLKPGDKTRLEIQGIGVLENQVEGY
jgi:2-keto-4-pentenoate hydratase/2-oxohepta-3-ene-1,7-dioic acid hydratase in catechol pathway|tara:strand:+ start:2925 stop:3791 length:867 start_codon:yes stop_codon:yes gene_type:complete